MLPNTITQSQCLDIASRYASLEAWKAADPDTYRLADGHLWLTKCKQRIHHQNQINECIASASKYKTMKDWGVNDNQAYQKAYRIGCTHMCTKHMKDCFTDLTMNKCLEEAKKYDTPIDWLKGDSATLKAAKRNHWYKSCIAHMTKPAVDLDQRIGQYNLEDCKEIAACFELRVDWLKVHPSSFKTAKRNGWLDFCLKNYNKNIEADRQNTTICPPFPRPTKFAIEDFIKQRDNRPVTSSDIS
ncbi:hypothetical protein QTV49_004202 [Vibrio vulnificus]|nr:hypothetical protein [Vibrio vulnificus]